jgi:hypothetical protein
LHAYLVLTKLLIPLNSLHSIQLTTQPATPSTPNKCVDTT